MNTTSQENLYEPEILPINSVLIIQEMIEIVQTLHEIFKLE